MYANLLTNLFTILHPALFFQTLDLRGALHREVVFFVVVVVVHLCNSGFTQLGEEVSSNDTSNYLAYYQGLVLIFFFEGQRDKWESLQGNGADRLKLNLQA